MKRRSFIRNTAFASISGIVMPQLDHISPIGSGELLYNGIRLPKVWPPKNMDSNSYVPMQVPYLDNPPEIIPIDVGRQLFIDDFLIEETTLNRKFHKAKKYSGNPVLKPDIPLEKGKDGLPVACPKDGGVWWDPEDKLFKMWYEAGWVGSMAYATSKNGIHWERPDLDVETRTNRIVKDLRPDSTTVFLDHDTRNKDERFKMFLRCPNFLGDSGAACMVSADGIHWSEPVWSGHCGDRSTMFYNPFRKKWVFSIRNGGRLKSGIGRARYYHEHSNYLKGAKWDADKVVFWTGADKLDLPDPVIGKKAQLYNLSAVAYESLMLGIHEIHLGPSNKECMKRGEPKITELMLSFSRDGFHWHRPDREAFIPATRQEGSWERGYVQPAGGICMVVGDQLWFYYTGFEGDSTNHHMDQMKSGMYANGSTGIAVLRRDGFASMSATRKTGTLTTRLVTFKGNHLFVNVNCPGGELLVEVLDKNGNVIEPFSKENCVPVAVDSTIRAVKWKGNIELNKLAGQEIRFQFYLTDGDLYSFWVSPDISGASFGYNAAGGSGFEGGKDEQGINAYRKSQKIQIKIRIK